MDFETIMMIGICIFVVAGLIYAKIKGPNSWLEKVPPEVQEELSRKPNYRKLDEKDREQYKSSSWKYGFGIYLFMVVCVVVIGIASGTPGLIPMMFLCTLPIGIAIALLVIGDMTKVSSKKQLYVVKAYCVYRIYGRTASMGLAYYNFMTAQYELKSVSMSASAQKKDVTSGSFVEVLVEQKNDKLKVIDVV